MVHLCRQPLDEVNLKELKLALQTFMKKGETLQLDTKVSSSVGLLPIHNSNPIPDQRPNPIRDCKANVYPDVNADRTLTIFYSLYDSQVCSLHFTGYQ